jgi:hypothetical protein
VSALAAPAFFAGALSGAFSPGFAFALNPGPRSLQPPPGQLEVQVEPAGHCVMHLPPAQVTLQVAPAEQCSLHSPPGQSSAQVEPLAHFMSHLPPAHDSLQVASAAHASLHLPSLQPWVVAAPAVAVLVPPGVAVPPVALAGCAPPVVAVPAPLVRAPELDPVGSELAGWTAVPVDDPEAVPDAAAEDSPVAEPEADAPDLDDPPERGSDSGIGPE